MRENRTPGSVQGHRVTGVPTATIDMIGLLPKVILYPFIGVCWLAAYSQYLYFSAWIAGVDNPVRWENLAAVLLIGVLSSFGWGGALVLAIWKKEMFSKVDRTIAILSGLAVVAATI